MTTRTGILGAGVIATGLILAGCATRATNGPPNPARSAASTHDATCLTQTGSRIGGSGTDCLGIGRSYTHDDIKATGATTVGDALPLLDPAITVTH